MAKIKEPTIGKLYECIIKKNKTNKKYSILLWYVGGKPSNRWQLNNYSKINEEVWSIIWLKKPLANFKLIQNIRKIVIEEMAGQEGSKYYTHCQEILSTLEYSKESKDIRKIIEVIAPLETYPRIKIKDMIFDGYPRKVK